MSEIGSDFFQEGSFELTSVDTLTIKVSTVAFDSLVTSGTSRLLVGYHDDEELGKISSVPYFQIVPHASNDLYEVPAAYTRTGLVLTFDGYSYYDTLVQTTWNAHQVTEEIKTDNGHFYNTTSFNFNSQPIGTVSFRPEPNSSDSIEIPISDEFGREVFQLTQQSAEVVTSAGSFLKYFHGLAIVPSHSVSSSLIGFSSNAELRVYYIDKSQTPAAEKYLTFSTEGSLSFNSMQLDRGPTVLGSLLTTESSVSSSRTNRKSYMQAGAGLGIRVELPYLKDLLLENKTLVILRAILEMTPLKSTEKNVTAPATLAASVVNGENEFIDSLANEPTLIEDVYLGRDTHYEVDIATFLDQQLSTREFNEDALLFTVDDQPFRSSVERLYIGDQRNEYEMVLTVYCLLVKQ